MFKKKPRKEIIVKQEPWLIISYSDIQNKGEDDEFDQGYIQFVHEQTGKEFLKEMQWLRGEGAYNFEGFKPPTLLDIWNIFIRITPGTTGFCYKNWHIHRKSGCFMYILVDQIQMPPIEIHKNIIGDLVSKERQDFASFIDMLDNIEESLKQKQQKSIPFDLEEYRKKRDAV